MEEKHKKVPLTSYKISNIRKDGEIDMNTNPAVFRLLPFASN